MIRTYTMRLKVTRKQDETMQRFLAQLCELYNIALMLLEPHTSLQAFSFQRSMRVGVKRLYHLFSKSSLRSNPEDTLVLPNGNLRFGAYLFPECQELLKKNSSPNEFDRRLPTLLTNAAIPVYNSSPEVLRFTKIAGWNTLVFVSPSGMDESITQTSRPNRKLNTVLNSFKIISRNARWMNSQYLMRGVEEGSQIENMSTVNLGNPDGQSWAATPLVYATISKDKSHPVERVWGRNIKSAFIQGMTALCFRKRSEWYSSSEQKPSNRRGANSMRGSELHKIFSSQITLRKVVTLFLCESALHVPIVTQLLTFAHNAALNILRLGESLASKQNCVLATERESCI
jgi:hypothetical protein